MQSSEMLGSFEPELLRQIAERSQLIKFQPGEKIIREGDPSDSFFMLIEGEAAVLGKTQDGESEIELGQLSPPVAIGEIGLLLDQPRTATIRATLESQLLKFDRQIYNYMFENFPQVGIAVSKFLASRVQQLSARISLPQHDPAHGKPTPAVLKMLPMDLIIRHRVLPLKMVDGQVFVGVVDDPTPTVIGSLHRLLPSLEMKLVRISGEFFDEVLKASSGLEDWQTPETGPETEAIRVQATSPKLDPLLKRLQGEGASDLHLPAGQVPRWRIDGDIKPIADSKPLKPEEALDLLKPVMNERSMAEFNTHRDADFAYSVPGAGRFRVNIYRDDRGVSAAIRVIPSNILTLDQLRLPPAVKQMCELPKGLVLVTGPSGCGKSTTLAGMVDYINQTRTAHIITLEDPIEFVHQSEKSLINQREMGRHFSGFTRGLRSSLREDPDIVMVGEMRDFESISLAIESANTGHLVLASLHTSTAVSTIHRIIDAYPPDMHDQAKDDLAECLKGVVSQTLLKKVGGGRLGAFEVLVVTKPIGNMIREEKLIQIPNMMRTGKTEGHVLMNEALAELTNVKKVAPQEAMHKSLDKEDLRQRLHMKV